MSDVHPDKPAVKRIRWLWGTPYPVAVVSLVWGIVAGLACALAINVLPLPQTLVVVVILGVIGGIAIGLSLKRWPPAGLKEFKNRSCLKRASVAEWK